MIIITSAEESDCNPGISPDIKDFKFPAIIISVWYFHFRVSDSDQLLTGRLGKGVIPLILLTCLQLLLEPIGGKVYIKIKSKESFYSS